MSKNRYPRRFRERYQQKRIDQVTRALDKETEITVILPGLHWSFGHLFGHLYGFPEPIRNTNSYSSFRGWLQNVVYRPKKKKYNKLCHAGRSKSMMSIKFGFARNATF